jgi:hypothetical protein
VTGVSVSEAFVLKTLFVFKTVFVSLAPAWRLESRHDGVDATSFI